MAILANESLREVATKLGAQVAKYALVSGRCSEWEVTTKLGEQVTNARQAFKCFTRHRKARCDALGQDSGGTRAGQLEAVWRDSWRQYVRTVGDSMSGQLEAV